MLEFINVIYPFFGAAVLILILINLIKNKEDSLSVYLFDVLSIIMFIKIQSVQAP